MKKETILLGFAILFTLFGCANNSSEEEAILSSTTFSSSMEENSSSSESSSSSSIPVVLEADSNFVLWADFNNSNSVNQYLGAFYTFNDNRSGGASSFDQEEMEEMYLSDSTNDSNQTLRLSYQLDKADYKWDAYVALGMNITDTSISPKLENFQGLRYTYRGAEQRLRLEVEEVTDHDHFFVTVPASEEWTTFTIGFDDFAQEGWGTAVPFLPNSVIKIAWEFRGKTGEEDFFEMDNFGFLYEVNYPIMNDMRLREPKVPDEDTLAVVKVETELNELTLKYLTKGFNFTNWLEQEKFDSTFKYDESNVQQHSEQGFKSLRLPIDLDLYVIDRDSVVAGAKEFALDSILFTVLDSFEVWTARHGMSFTIDYHQYDGSFTGTTVADPGYRAMAARVWKEVAAYYANNDREDLFYELTNEPDLGADDDKISQSDWRSLAQMMIDSIRTVDSKHAIIFGDVEWYSIDKLIQSEPFADDKIIYAFHFYDPFIFTHQGASWSGMATTKRVPFPYSIEDWSTEYRFFGVNEDLIAGWQIDQFRSYYKNGNKTAMKNKIIEVKRWAAQHQVPLVCNEWGAYQRSAEIEHLNNYNRAMGEIFEELGIAWQVWFGVFDNDRNLLPGMAEALKLQ